jgi:ribosomal-protein-alanine N-acetyltransferase
MRDMASPRLTYERVSPASLDEFHSLVVDAHIRRYLMDDTIFPPEWTRERIGDSEALFARRGVGLWLARETASGALLGFCGFLELPSVHPDPQVVYALLERFTGRGYATEMAQASIAHARLQDGFGDVIAAADEVNAVSLHIIEKLGFVRIGTTQGNLGNTFVYKLTT